MSKDNPFKDLEKWYRNSIKKFFAKSNIKKYLQEKASPAFAETEQAGPAAEEVSAQAFPAKTQEAVQ